MGSRTKKRRRFINGSMSPFNNLENKIILEPDFISESKKDINIFFHICCINNYEYIAEEIINDIIKSGLYEKCKRIYYSILGKYSDSFFRKIIRFPKLRLLYLSEDVSQVEYPTLINLQNFCRSNDSYILYIHTKGVSLPHDIYRQKWRKRLMQKVAGEYKTCVSLLNEGCDIAGCGWKEKKSQSEAEYNVGDFPHYSGNFWWANSDYIKKLPDISKIKDQVDVIKNSDFLKYRTKCEFWIGMNNGIKVGVNGELNKEYSNTNYCEEKTKPLTSNTYTNEKVKINIKD